ncbi:MAG TPA: hypothetical protein VIU62_04070, partial [Chloroflexota bacterium]
MAGSVVQVASAFSNPTATTLTATFAANTTAGNTLVAIFGTGGTNAPTADSADTWTAVTGSPFAENGKDQAAWYVLSCVGGKKTYTFSRSNTGNCSLIVAEINAPTALDVQHNASATASATTSTGSATTTNASDFLVALFLTDQNYSPANPGYDSTTLTSGWTWQGSSGPSTGASNNNNNTDVGIATRAVTATGAYSASVGTTGAATTTANL